MNFASVIGIALVIGTIAVLGIAIVSYMSSLVRNAYELKVEMRKDLDDGIKQVKAETIKSVKSARTELMGEVDRTRNNLMDDLKARQAATEATLTAELKKRDAAWAEEREALTTQIAELKEQLKTLKDSQKSRQRLKAEQVIAEETAASPEKPADPTKTTKATETTENTPAAQAVELTTFPEAQKANTV